MTEKCKKCFWYFSIRDHRGKVWARACYHAIDGLLDGQDIQPIEDCFEARKRSQEAEMEMKEIKLPSNEEFINHLAEDLHGEVGIKIYDDK